MIPQFTTERRPEAWTHEVTIQLSQTVGQGPLILGDGVRKFEESFAHFVGSKYCIGVANGMDALTLACITAGVEPGDEVIVPAYSFVATWLAPLKLGAALVPVDVCPRSGLLDVSQALAAVSKRTAAVIVVHLYGRPALTTEDADRFRSLGVRVIEDAAQAHGARSGDDMVGSIGDLAAYSFYPTKNLGALGDAGAVTTSSPDFNETLRSLRNYGASNASRYDFERVGLNSRLDEIQARALSVSLAYLDQWNHRRREIAERYSKLLSAVDENLLMEREPSHLRSVWHQFPISVQERDRVMVELAAAGVQTGLHYPYWIGSVTALAGSGLIRLEGDFTGARELAARELSLPMFPELADRELDRVVEALAAAINR